MMVLAVQHLCSSSFLCPAECLAPRTAGRMINCRVAYWSNVLETEQVSTTTDATGSLAKLPARVSYAQVGWEEAREGVC